jgi:hypothetical protein
MILDADTLLMICLEIRDSPLYPVSHKKNVFAEKYPDYATAYPQLLNMAVDPTADFTHLAFMMKQLKEVQSQRVSLHDASVKIGELFATQYVTPIVERLDAEKAANVAAKDHQD